MQAIRKEKEMDEQRNLEERNLKELMKAKKIVKFFLMNGFQVWGRIMAFDGNVVIIRETKTETVQMIYRHAISTVVL